MLECSDCLSCRYYMETYFPRIQFVHQFGMPAAVFKDLYLWGGNSQCAELCGRAHGFMPIVVNVVERDEYDAWLADKTADAAKIKELMAQEFTLEEQVARGKDVYMRSCVACHGVNGEGGVGKAIAGSSVATGEMNEHVNILVNGVPGSAMQAFGGQLNDVDLSAVITFTRNAFGNNMGDKVQPIDVYQFKQGQ